MRAAARGSERISTLTLTLALTLILTLTLTLTLTLGPSAHLRAPSGDLPKVRDDCLTLTLTLTQLPKVRDDCSP